MEERYATELALRIVDAFRGRTVPSAQTWEEILTPLEPAPARRALDRMIHQFKGDPQVADYLNEYHRAIPSMPWRRPADEGARDWHSHLEDIRRRSVVDADAAAELAGYETLARMKGVDLDQLRTPRPAVRR